MEIDDLKELILFLKNTDITEISIEAEGAKVKLKREQLLSQMEYQPIAPAQHQAVPTQPRPQEAAPAEEDESHRLITITAPLVGTFYQASSPEAAPFVEAGAHVRKGQVICIIEAMKLMNEIEADAEGTIVKVLVENGQPVEYGEPLFLLEPGLE